MRSGAMGNKDLVEIDLTIKAETDMALLVDDGCIEEVWLPKSQIQYDEDAEVGDTIIVDVPEWLALDKGLI